MSNSYPEQYAVVVRDAKDLFLMFEINRSLQGDVYINFNPHHKKHKPHSSYHASGQLHHKSSNIKVFPPMVKQSPKMSFTGSEQIITTSIKRGEARAWNRSCTLSDYHEVMEINDMLLPAEGYQLIFEVVEQNMSPWASTYPYAKVIQQHFFKKGNPWPWIAVSLYEVHL